MLLRLMCFGITMNLLKGRYEAQEWNLSMLYRGIVLYFESKILFFEIFW